MTRTVKVGVRQAFWFIGLLFSFNCSALAQSKIPPAPVTVQLSTLQKTVHPGEKVKVSVTFSLQPDWHIYYKNPGESGMPTQVTWQLPKGFAAEPLQWQAPEKFVDAGITTYGYKNKAILTATLTSPRSAQAGTNAHIEASVKWLACKNSCVPGSTNVSLSLPIR